MKKYPNLAALGKTDTKYLEEALKLSDGAKERSIGMKTALSFGNISEKYIVEASEASNDVFEKD